MRFLRLLHKTAARFQNSHFYYRYAVNMLPVDRDAVKEYWKHKTFFLILSTGRTGTTMFAQMLNQCPDVDVVHEPVPNENYALVEASLSTATAERYIRRFRSKEMYLRVGKHNDAKSYGEVNGALRRHLEPLRACFPNLKMLMIVRDGRDVVRSIMSRGTFSSTNSLYRNYRPPLIDFGAEWSRFTEFERCCWAWTLENRNMRTQINSKARFEDIITSYDAFRSGVLDPLGLTLKPSIWQNSIARPVNETTHFKLPGWSDWTERERGQFKEICGEEMAFFDYRI